MAWFKIYAGMGGGFGGATYYGTYDCCSEDEAMSIAYSRAVEEYQSYEGYHGILSWDDCLEAWEESWGTDHTESDINAYYQEEIESWISYYVVPASGPDDVEEE